MEDDQIHCFKTLIPSGLETLKRAAENELLNDITDSVTEIDLLQDEENGFLSDNSIEF